MKKLPAEQIEKDLKAKLIELNDMRLVNDSPELARMVIEGFRSISSGNVESMQSSLDKIISITAKEMLEVAEEKTIVAPSSEPIVEDLRAKLIELNDMRLVNDSPERARMVIEAFRSIKSGDIAAMQSSLDKINLYTSAERFKAERFKVEVEKLRDLVRKPTSEVDNSVAIEAGEVYMNHLLASGMKQENVLDKVTDVIVVVK